MEENVSHLGKIDFYYDSTCRFNVNVGVVYPPQVGTFDSFIAVYYKGRMRARRDLMTQLSVNGCLDLWFYCDWE